ncbi:aldehyde dehydrogenase family protein [Corynebacterium felinum]|uniref:Sulfoacetaldehyde dehydrogenase n=1 Tax=Corynebacterium felinum TaxID=131318 RepID=A0ABU2BA13_9CORY|nr:aldehyde dehydrogenase family protein [Corynebacterium felinum]MDF5821760.1 aldehyde dehydrogenase family protein [Corynebacterium felinum]MDR7355433.1 sulfoacetaldehyde dehydrogenase [Corynebacterium felinum]WJY94784.1 Sulfoacetaldehyde dehydrogenase (acylating) [Corynebacterium felinum]
MENIDTLIANAHAAYQQLDANQHHIDRIVATVGWACYRPDHVAGLGHAVVKATGLGNPNDIEEIHKNRILGTLTDLHAKTTVGKIRVDHARGLEWWARPLGVIALITPTTAPTSAVATSVLMALKAGNAIIVSPHPATRTVIEKIITWIQNALAEADAPTQLVQLAPPLDRHGVTTLMEASDFVIATGGTGVVQRAYHSGTPAISSGTGNATIIIDQNVDLNQIACTITRGAAYNNGTSCSSESNILIHHNHYTQLLQLLRKHGAYICTEEETERIIGTLWPEGKARRDLLGVDAGKILAAAGINARLAHDHVPIVLPRSGTDSRAPELGEKLAPVVTVQPWEDFRHACAFAGEILRNCGRGHSCGLYMNDDEQAAAKIAQVIAEVETSRVMVNQSTMGNAGAACNGLTYTSVVSTGTWGGCSTSVNMGVEHLMQYTVVSRPIVRKAVEKDDLFAAAHSYRAAKQLAGSH